MSFNATALWSLAAFVLLMAIATGEVAIGIGAVVAATVIVELLTWVGALGGPKDERR
jgi:hypothetical protein